MIIPPEFPPEMRAFVEDELAAGNQIVEVGHSFPAPPAGAYVKLALLVTTRPHQSQGGISFYARNNSIYSGEFADERRFFFVLEPPLPPPPEPDMDAIRAAVNYDPVQSFAQSMKLDYDKWREGTPYDLDAIAKLKAGRTDQLYRIERLILDAGVEGWRDVQALAALDTPGARQALKNAMKSRNAEVRMAVTRFAPKLVNKKTKLASLVEALRTAEFYGGLSQALEQAETLHPPEVMDTLFQGTLRREGGVAVHFAALLLYLHGQAAEPFDWTHRPFCLRFNTENKDERRQVFVELCERVGVDPRPFLAG